MVPVDTDKIISTEMERVRDTVPVLFERDDTFYSRVEKKEVEIISERDMRGPLEIRTGGNFGYYDPNGGSLGRGSGSTFDKFVINTVHMRHAIEWTKKAEWGTDSSRKAVINTFRRLVASAMPEFRRNIDSQTLTAGDGVIGTISAVSTGSGVDTYTLDSDGYGARLVRFGQFVNVYDSTLATNRTAGAEREVTYWDVAGKQIKVAAVTGATTGDKLVSSGLSGATPTGFYGVTYHNSSASTGSWLGLDRASNPEIRANSVTASGSLALPFPRLAINKIGDRMGKDFRNKKLEAWMHPCQQQAYEQLGQLISIIQKQAKEESLDLYFNDQMQMAGAPVQTHYSWNKKRIDFLSMDGFGRAEMHPAGFYTDASGRRFFEVRSTDGGVATADLFYLVASFNMFHENPGTNSYISALTIPTGY